MSLSSLTKPWEAMSYGFLDGSAKRELRRKMLKSVAVPGCQMPYASREVPMARGWGTGGLQVSLTLVNPQTCVKIIDQGGAIISELPMRQRPDRRTFPMRNRIIAAISPATIVVEAGVNSGSIITAERAIEFKKDLYAVPGRIDTPHSQGCNELIQKGAKLLMSIDDIKESDTFLPGFDLSISENASTINANEKNQPGPKDPIQASLFSKIRNEGELSFENLSKHSQLTVSDLLTILMDMELEGYIKQLPGQRFAILSE